MSDVFWALRTSILTGEIEPGTRINIDAVTRSMDASPTSVREVLHRLEDENLVLCTPGRAYSTTPLLDLAELHSLFDFRLLVEPWAARSAAVNGLANPAAALDRELSAFRDKMQHSGDHRQDLAAHDMRFHDTILSAAGNPVVWRAFAQTHCHLHTFRLYSQDVYGALTLAEHSSVLDAIRTCQPDRAEKAMAEHIRNSFTRFAQAIEDNVALPPLEDNGPPQPHIVG